jgi:glutamate synthase (NADPH/NADH) large chain
VGIATQDPELTRRFAGQPEHLINYFFFVAEEVRELMAQLGFRTFEEMGGRVDRLDMRRGISHWKAQGLDFSRIFHSPDMPVQVARSWKERQDHGLEQALDHVLIAQSKTAIEQGQAVVIETGVRNVNRSVGAMLSGEVARHHGFAGLPQDTILVRAKGTAGQSFGAFLAHGVTFHLYGEANDYVGKGLSGGRIIIQPAPESTLLAEENIIVGNTVLYGAVAGECYFRGVAGERFAVRNSGAVAVVEGVGDHGCEYMTGGTVVVLGEAGRNFAAGMSGGIAFVYDEAGDFDKRCNLSMVALEAVPEEEQTTEVKGVLDTHGRVRVNHIEARDEYLLRILIENHVRYTGSTRGQQILDQWSSARSKFVKVMPLEYRRALAEMAAEQQLAQVA